MEYIHTLPFEDTLFYFFIPRPILPEMSLFSGGEGMDLPGRFMTLFLFHELSLLLLLLIASQPGTFYSFSRLLSSTSARLSTNS